MLRCLPCSSFFPLGRSTGLVQTSHHYGCQLRICTKYAGHCGRVWNRHHFGSPDCRRCCCRYHGHYGKKIRVFFPPLITGTVVFTIGLSLYPTAINYMAGGTLIRIMAPGRTGWWLSLPPAVVTALNHFWKKESGAFFYSDRYAGRICGIHSIWNGGSFKRG